MMKLQITEREQSVFPDQLKGWYLVAFQSEKGGTGSLTILDSAIIVAPQINIFGLLLNVLDPNPKIKSFFEKKGAFFQEIVENGKKFFGMSGNFSITPQEIELFFQNNPDIERKVVDKELLESQTNPNISPELKLTFPRLFGHLAKIVKSIREVLYESQEINCY